MDTIIRPEQPDDVDGVRHVNRSAFETALEATLVDALRQRASPIVSLVAVSNETVVGHILFSPVTHSSDAALRIMGLAPMAVVPERQRQGIGSELVRAGLDECRKLDVDAVIVLGHAEYYPRFGFVPASRFGLSSEYDVPDEVFMVLELKAGVLRGQEKRGRLCYHAAFGEG
jgi:putative acetyltransferase